MHTSICFGSCRVIIAVNQHNSEAICGDDKLLWWLCTVSFVAQRLRLATTLSGSWCKACVRCVLVLNQFQSSKSSNMIIYWTVMIFAVAWVYITFNLVAWPHLFWDRGTFLPGEEVICEFRIYLSKFDQWSLQKIEHLRKIGITCKARRMKRNGLKTKLYEKLRAFNAS